MLYIKAVDLIGNTAAPFPIKFDPLAELTRDERRDLEMTAGSWVAFGQSNGDLLYLTQLVTYRCAIRELRIGVDNTSPDKVIALPPCDPAHPYEIPEKFQPYLRLPLTTKMVTVELTYSDGSVSETKTFKR